jgi:hypothetical protein
MLDVGGAATAAADKSITHLMLECHKWRGQREAMLVGLETKEVRVPARKDENDMCVLFREAVRTMPWFMEHTAIGESTSGTSQLPIEMTMFSLETTIKGGGRQGWREDTKAIVEEREALWTKTA